MRAQGGHSRPCWRSRANLGHKASLRSIAPRDRANHEPRRLRRRGSGTPRACAWASPPGASSGGQTVLECLKVQLDEMIPRVRQVITQTRARIFRGETRTESKIFTLLEPSTEIIRKGKA